jgi:outer membrane receptor for ferrienterochelin and colicins
MVCLRAIGWLRNGLNVCIGHIFSAIKLELKSGGGPMKKIEIHQHAQQALVLKGGNWEFTSLLAALLFSRAAFAETNERDLSELSLDELLDTKIQTVTAAAKRTQSINEAPSAVSVITSDEIRKSGYQNLGEILANTRGFYTSSDRNYTYLGVRGFGRPGDYNSRVLVLVNGQRMNDNVTGGALIGNEFLIEPDLIDRVEIIRGPGSSLYGSNAFFAVVNVITRNGKDLNGAEATFTAGSLDTYMGRFSYGTVIRKDIDLLISGNLMERGGNSSLYFPEYDDPSTANGVTRDTDGESRRSLFSHVAWKGLTLEGGWVERQKQIPTGSFDTLFGDPRNETIDGTHYGKLRLEHQFENELHLDASISSTSYTFDGSYMYEDPQLTQPYRFVDRIRGQWLTEEIQLNRTWWDRWTVTLGMEARQNLSQDQNNYQEDPYLMVLEAPRTSQTWGPFFDTSLNILTNLTLAAGVRHDRGDFDGSRTSPRASLIYRPIQPTTLKFLYGQAFRAPNAYERFYEDGLTQKRNPNLTPESIDTYEVVVEQELGQHFQASASGYVYFVDDLIDQVLDTDGLLVYRNHDRVRGRGLEFEFSGRFQHGLRSRLSYSIQQSKDRDTSMQLSNSPERLLQASLVVPVYH